MLSFVRPQSRRPPSWTDRMLGVSRRRRQAAYAAFYAGYSLLRPAVRRVAHASAVGLLFLLLLVLRARF